MRNQLVAKAKNGDQEAIDSLTIDEIDLSTRINRRILSEDLYSIVETSFIPYGSESDNYSIIGTILNWNKANNPYTNEDIYDTFFDYAAGSFLIHIILCCINNMLSSPYQLRNKKLFFFSIYKAPAVPWLVPCMVSIVFLLDPF